jgi:uncharacterized protein YqeY
VTLKERLLEDQKLAMRQHDEVRVSTLRLLRSAIRNAEIAQGRDLDDAGVLAVIQKEAKQRRESIEEFTKARREDLLHKEEAELAILLSYLPEQLTPEEIEGYARQAIAEVGAAGPRDMGRVMGILIPRLKGKADGRLISQVVQRLLASVPPQD